MYYHQECYFYFFVVNHLMSRKLLFRVFAPLLINHFPAALKSSLLVVGLFLGSYCSERTKLKFEYVFLSFTKTLWTKLSNRFKTNIPSKYGIARTGVFS